MIRPNHLRAALSGRRLSACFLCCLLLAASGQVTSAQTRATDVPAVESPAPQTSAAPAQDAAAKPEDGQGTTTAVVGAHMVESTPSKRQLHEAENAYVAGAKKLEHDDLDAAEQQFIRALKLDPENRNYAVAISVTRQHRLTELVQQASKARQAGEHQKADSLLAEAREIDPQNPLVLEHSGPFIVSSAGGPRSIAAASGQASPSSDTDTGTMKLLADRTL